MHSKKGGKLAAKTHCVEWAKAKEWRQQRGDGRPQLWVGNSSYYSRISIKLHNWTHGRCAEGLIPHQPPKENVKSVLKASVYYLYCLWSNLMRLDWIFFFFYIKYKWDNADKSQWKSVSHCYSAVNKGDWAESVNTNQVQGQMLDMACFVIRHTASGKFHLHSFKRMRDETNAIHCSPVDCRQANSATQRGCLPLQPRLHCHGHGMRWWRGGGGSAETEPIVMVTSVCLETWCKWRCVWWRCVLGGRRRKLCGLLIRAGGGRMR